MATSTATTTAFYFISDVTLFIFIGFATTVLLTFLMIGIFTRWMKNDS